MSTSVLPQLLEVDSELLAQTSALEAQLTALQEKRKGIQTVISMFESGAMPEAADIAAAVTSATTPKASKAKASTKPSNAKAGAKSATKAKAASKTPKASSGKSVKTKTKTKASKSKVTGRLAKAKTSDVAAQKAAGGKRSGRTANWQKYVQDGYSKAPLPDVIVGVLQAQPKNIFKIADVMNVVFKEDMPKNQFLKARNRVSNILSAGARDGVWYRGRGGTYSISEKAIKAAG